MPISPIDGYSLVCSHLSWYADVIADVSMEINSKHFYLKPINLLIHFTLLEKRKFTSSQLPDQINHIGTLSVTIPKHVLWRPRKIVKNI